MAFESNYSAGPDDLGGSYLTDPNARWSVVLARPPQWLAEESPAVINWYKANVYDDGKNFQSILDSLVNAFKQESANRGLPVDATDARVLQTIGELAVGEVSWDQLVAIRQAPNNPLEAQGDRLVPATTYASGTPSSINVGGAAVIAAYSTPPGGVPMPGQQDAYGTVTTAGMEGTAPGTLAHAAAAGAGTALPSFFSPTSTTTAGGFSLGGLNPIYLAAGAVLLFFLLHKKGGR